MYVSIIHKLEVAYGLSIGTNIGYLDFEQRNGR